LDAKKDGAHWQEVAKLVLHIDPGSVHIRDSTDTEVEEPGLNRPRSRRHRPIAGPLDGREKLGRREMLFERYRSHSESLPSELGYLIRSLRVDEVERLRVVAFALMACLRRVQILDLYLRVRMHRGDNRLVVFAQGAVCWPTIDRTALDRNLLACHWHFKCLLFFHDVLADADPAGFGRLLARLELSFPQLYGLPIPHLHVRGVNP